MCNDIIIVEYDRRRSALPSAPLDIKYDNNKTEQSTAIVLNIKHNPYITITPLYSHIHTYSHSSLCSFCSSANAFFTAATCDRLSAIDLGGRAGDCLLIRSIYVIMLVVMYGVIVCVL